MMLTGSAFAQWVGVDPTFPAGAGPDNVVRAMAVQSDGRVLIGGWFKNVDGAARAGFARLHADGGLDLQFAPRLGGEPVRIHPLADNRIVVSGSFTNVNGTPRPGLARLNGDGSLDTGFVPPTPSDPATR